MRTTDPKVMRLPEKLDALKKSLDDGESAATLEYLFDLIYHVAPGYKLGEFEDIGALRDYYGIIPAPIMDEDHVVPPFNPKMIAKLLAVAMEHGDEDPLVLEDWCDWDGAAFELGVRLGLWPSSAEDPLSFPVRHKHVFWSDNELGNALHETLNELVELGVLEKNDDDELQYRSKK